MSQPEDSPPNAYNSPSRHHTHTSLITSVSGVADSTISYNTYATGITEGSLNLSQFPPPPVTLPSSPAAERSFPSPSQSTFTLTAPPRIYPGIDQRQGSPARSTFTVTASTRAFPGIDEGQPSPSSSTSTFLPHAQNHASGSASPIVRPGLARDRDLPSPAQSTFTITSPLSTSTAPLLPVAHPVVSSSNRELSDDSSSSHGLGNPQNFDPRAESQSPIPLLMGGKLSPNDWLEGSSLLSVDPTEERMLSTSFITSLLSSSTPDKTPSPGDGSPQGLHPPPSQADVGRLVSETSYPPSSLRHNEPVAGSGNFLPSSHPSTSPGEGPDVSVLGMVLRHLASETSVSESLHQQSQATYGSTAPLNPHPPSAFSSAMDKMQTTVIQPSTVISQRWTPERSASPDFSSSKKSVKPQRRTSAQSSKTIRSHVSSLISSVGQRAARAAHATMGWRRVKPLPPIPTIPHTSLYQEQEHRRMEGAVPLPLLAERADRLAVMLDSGHLPHNGVIHPSRFSSDKGSATNSRRLHGAKSDKPLPEGSHTPWKSKLFLKLPINRNGKIKLFIGASVLALLVLIGIIVGVVVGRRHAHSVSCSANRTGNTCSLSEYRAPYLAY